MPEEHPQVKFDAVKRANYHEEKDAQGKTVRAYHGVPEGFHFDEAGVLTPIHPLDLPQCPGGEDPEAHHRKYLARQAEKARGEAKAPVEKGKA